ncbi:MAG: hypothetical protein WAU07_04895 [Microgenomates group bacterium]
MKNAISVFILVITSLLVCSIYFQPNIPYTHDGENHLARFANYYIAVKEDQIPPRWAPNLMNRYGYPVFNYNYPLANIISIPLRELNISYENIFRLITVISILSGAIGTYYWVKTLNFSFGAALLSAIAWISAPYITNLLVFRGTIGETIALSLVPWLIAVSVKLLQFKKIKGANSSKLIAFGLGILLWSMLFLSHNLTVLIATPVILLLIFLTARKNEKVAIYNASYTLLGLVLCLSVGFSLWFWLPAVFEIDAVVLSAASNNQEFSSHFVSISQILFAPISFGYSRAGSVDDMSFAVGSTQLTGLLLGLLAIIFNSKKIPFYTKNVVTGILCISALLLFLQFEVSSFFWKIPMLRYVQFPWRLSGILVTILAPVFAFGFDSSKNIWKVAVITVVAIQLLTAVTISPADTFSKTDIDYESFSQSTSTQNENLPKDFTYQNIADWKPAPTIENGSGIVEVLKWSGSEHSYNIVLNSNAIIVEPTAWFPGWQTTVNGSQISHDAKDIKDGRLAYSLSAGNYQVHSKFTQRTPARVLGNAVFVGTSFLTIGIALWIKKST